MPKIKLINAFELLRDDIEKAYERHHTFEVPPFPDNIWEDRPMKKVFKLIGELIKMLPGFFKRILELYWQNILVWAIFMICIGAVAASGMKAAAFLFSVMLIGNEWRCAWHRRRHEEIKELQKKMILKLMELMSSNQSSGRWGK